MSSSIAEWKRNILFLAILYEIQEQGRKVFFPVSGEDALLKPAFDDMVSRGLLIDSHVTNTYQASEDGEKLRGQMVAMYDQLLKFEIFGAVNQALQLTTDISPNGTDVFDDLLDPRFTKSPESEDLRLAMLDWYSTAAQEQLDGKSIDLHQVVFMQKLRAGPSNYNSPTFWSDLRTGVIFKEIDEIVTSAVKWQQMGGTEEEASAAMNAIYSAGMIEQIKRDGDRCSCGAYLGMYDYFSRVEGKTLESCPSCEKAFNVPAVQAASVTEECPNCGYEIKPRHRKCHGCGAKIDRKLPNGSVTEVTTETTVEDVYYTDSYYNPWSLSYLDYGYIPPPPIYPGVWYDPFDPIASVASFTLLCALF
jgi:predicted RNA-binding Zn-ribbon protein involved in translation (DUF1610 family)